MPKSEQNRPRENSQLELPIPLSTRVELKNGYLGVLNQSVVWNDYRFAVGSNNFQLSARKIQERPATVTITVSAIEGDETVVLGEISKPLLNWDSQIDDIVNEIEKAIQPKKEGEIPRNSV